MKVYYNDFDKKACAWLKELIADGLIPDGDIDDRSILDVKANDIRGYTQAHFFAGIGGWAYALRLARWPEDRKVWSGSCPCFPAGTLILTKRGYKPIEKINVGDYVLTHHSRFKRVTMVGSEVSKCVRVKGQGHFGLVCTPDHPFYVCDSGKPEWIKAKDLKGRRWSMPIKIEKIDMPEITRPRNGYFFSKWHNRYFVKGEKNRKNVYLGVFKNENDAKACVSSAIKERKISVRGADGVDPKSLKFAWFLGYWVGDGWTSRESVFLCGAKDDLQLLNDIFIGANLRGKAYLERTSSRIRSGSKHLSSWLKENFGDKAHGKFIPTWLHGMSEDYIRAFLDGYFVADGCKENGNTISFSTVSKALAIGIKVLLNQIRRPASIRMVKNKRRYVSIEGRKMLERPYYRVTSCDRSRSFVFTDNHGHGLVRSVENEGTHVVYNLSVDEDQSYVADGIVVHNCQPWSCAGKQLGEKDERHLWPAFKELIRECRPTEVVGEQVASALGRIWLSGVRADLEEMDYAIGAADLCAAGVGAPHIRQRLFWVARDIGLADSKHDGRGADEQGRRKEGRAADGWPRQSPSGLADAERTERRQDDERGRIHGGREEDPSGSERGRDHGSTVGMGNADEPRLKACGDLPIGGEERPEEPANTGSPGDSSPFRSWDDSIWHECRDGKRRRIPAEPKVQPVADGISKEVGLGGVQGDAPDRADERLFPVYKGSKGRIGILKGSGNAIVPQVAAEFLLAYLSITPEDEAKAKRQIELESEPPSMFE